MFIALLPPDLKPCEDFRQSSGLTIGAASDLLLAFKQRAIKAIRRHPMDERTKVQFERLNQSGESKPVGVKRRKGTVRPH